MTISSVTTKIISTLGNNTGSVVPIAVKDTLSNTAITYIYDKKASKHDGTEKAIEEFGTEVVWIFGIPLLKKAFDKTIYPLLKVNPDVDIRKFKKGVADSVEFAKEHVADAAQKNILNMADHKKSKSLFMAKFLVSTLVSLASLSGLIVFKQKNTQKNLENEAKKDYCSKLFLQKALNEETSKSDKFAAFMGKNQLHAGNNAAKKADNSSTKGANIAFGGVKDVLANFMYNPVMNMSILDGGITSTRLALGRKGEKGEIAFKEFFQIACIYLFAPAFDKLSQAISSKIFKKPINLDFDTLSNKSLKPLLEDENLGNQINFFKNNFKNIKDLNTQKQALEYVYNNQDTSLIKLLKMSKAVPVTKSGEINSLDFMQPNKILKMTNSIENLLSAFKKSKNPDKFIKKLKGTKGFTIILNILLGAALIGIIQPLLTIAGRKKNDGNTENPAIKEMKTQMMMNFN